MSVLHGDALEEMRKMPSGSFKAVITSPPYNLRNSTGGPKKGAGMWGVSKLFDDGYAEHDDNMPHADYVDWQRECLTEMLRLVPDDGAVFYNHKERVLAGRIQDRYDILQGFPLRQTIVWDRGGGFNFNPGYFRPSHEYIYLIAKPDFRLANDTCGFGTVWKIIPDKGIDHPAPFPVELARRCIEAVGSGPVLDPFFGSGTVGIAAKAYGIEWTGIEKSARYIDLAKRRIGRAVTPKFI